MAGLSNSGGIRPCPPEEIVGWFRAGGPPAVALSGGVDSAVVATFAHDAWGERAVGVTLVGPAVSERETRRARAVGAALGLRVEEVAVSSLDVEGYRTNPANRCYFCRSTEGSTLRAWGGPRGYTRFVDGVHLDDLGEDRPGLRAMDEAGFEHPLVWAGWGKTSVRAFARSRGLPNWDEPSDACLASRIRHGESISLEKLTRIERAEAFLADQGFRRVRVRVDRGRARVEVDPSDVARLTAPELAEATRVHLRGLGFTEVTVDPAGYRPRASG